RALGCGVEELFSLSQALPGPAIGLASGFSDDSRRLSVANVDGRWIGYPLAAARAIQEGFVSADVVLRASGSWTDAEYLTTPDRLEQTAVLLGCDPSLGILSARLSGSGSEGRLLW